MGIASLLSPSAPRAGSGHSPAVIFLTAVAVLAVVVTVDTLNNLLPHSLVAVVTGRLKLAFQRKQALRENLGLTLKNVKELEGLLPVCAWCKKVRNDEGYWQELETYLGPRIKAAFSHGICPECAARLRTENERQA